MSNSQSIDLQRVKEVAAQERQLAQTPGAMDSEQRRRHEHTANVLETLIPASNRPTMGEIEWDRKSHERAEAIAHWSNADPSPVIMLSPEGKKIAVYQDSAWFQGMRILNPDILTPTGRKFKLVPAGWEGQHGPFPDRQPGTTEPVEDRPEGCCGECPEIVGGGYDCTCADNPRCPNTSETLKSSEPQMGEAWIVEAFGEICYGLRDHEGYPEWTIVDSDGDRRHVGDGDLKKILSLAPAVKAQ